MNGRNEERPKRGLVMALLWMLSIPVLNIFYGLLNRPGENVRSLALPFDEWVPFVPAFVIPYLLWYPFIVLTLVYICRKSRLAYARTLIAVCLGLVACYLVYYFFQTSVERPVLVPDGFFERALQAVYATDQPYNCLPSIHVMTSYLMMRGAAVFGKRMQALVWIVALSVIASTLFVKQHVVVDIVAGVLVAEATYAAAGLITRRYRNRKFAKAREEATYVGTE